MKFKIDAQTSRGILHHRDSFFVFLYDQNDAGSIGIGECAPLKGLSVDDRPDFEKQLLQLCQQINSGTRQIDLTGFPSIKFGMQTAGLDLENGARRLLFPSFFTEGKDGIPINGLVWMGNYDFMDQQIREKIKEGFTCIKLKIGAIDFEKELALIRNIRKEFSTKDIEIRVDANGAFSPEEALIKIDQLAALNLHSIEQPIPMGNWEKMAQICEKTPLPVALDEELIGIFDPRTKKELLEIIKPQYIILKPSLLGGFEASEEWISLAERNHVGWWVTSALESNIGLNAIAQWTYKLHNKMTQGLGTGLLYTNNFPSPLQIRKGKLFFNPNINWDLVGLIE